MFVGIKWDNVWPSALQTIKHYRLALYGHCFYQPPLTSPGPGVEVMPSFLPTRSEPAAPLQDSLAQCLQFTQLLPNPMLSTSLAARPAWVLVKLLHCIEAYFNYRKGMKGPAFIECLLCTGGFYTSFHFILLAACEPEGFCFSPCLHPSVHSTSVCPRP